MRHAAHVAHHSRGRLRLRVPSAKGNAAELETIRKSLANVHGVKEVEVNESIGSVTIHYDARHHTDFHQHLAKETTSQDVVSVAPPCMREMGNIDEMIEHEATFLAQHSHSAKVLVDWTAALDRSVKRMTDNAIDLKVLAPAALAVGAFLELGMTAATPVWLTLGLFSFNHFIAIHSHPQSNDGQEPDEQSAPTPPERPKARKKQSR
jgi:hypothetical protein